jgi:MATE family multidrug resistance protein
MLLLSSIWQIFDATSLTLSEALRAAGDTAWCMAARIVLAWVVFTPAALVAVRWLGGGVVSVMCVFIAYVALLALTFAFRFASGRWRDLDLVGAEPKLV